MGVSMKMTVYLILFLIPLRLFSQTCNDLIRDIESIDQRQGSLLGNALPGSTVALLGVSPSEGYSERSLGQILNALNAEIDILNMLKTTFYDGAQELVFNDNRTVETRARQTTEVDPTNVGLFRQTAVNDALFSLLYPVESEVSGPIDTDSDDETPDPTATTAPRERVRSRVIEEADVNMRLGALPNTRFRTRDEFINLYLNERECNPPNPVSHSGGTDFEDAFQGARTNVLRFCEFSDPDLLGIVMEGLSFDVNQPPELRHWSPEDQAIAQVRNMLGYMYDKFSAIREVNPSHVGEVITKMRELVATPNAGQNISEIGRMIDTLTSTRDLVSAERQRIRQSSDYQLLEELKTAMSRHAANVCRDISICVECHVDPNYLAIEGHQLRMLRSTIGGVDRTITAVDTSAEVRELRVLCRTSVARTTAPARGRERGYLFPSCRELADEGDAIARASDRFEIMRQATGGYSFRDEGNGNYSLVGTRARSGWDVVGSYGAPRLVMGGLQAFGVNMMTNYSLPYWTAQAQWQKTYMYNQEAITDFQNEFMFNYLSNLPSAGSSAYNFGSYNFGYSSFANGGSFFTPASP